MCDSLFISFNNHLLIQYKNVPVNHLINPFYLLSLRLKKNTYER